MFQDKQRRFWDFLFRFLLVGFLIFVWIFIIFGCASSPDRTLLVVHEGELVGIDRIRDVFCIRVRTNDDTQVLSCRRPPTSTNKDVAKEAFGWIEHYAKNETPHIRIGGVVATHDNEEIISGIDIIPLLLSIHDRERDVWISIDLSFGESRFKEAMKMMPQLLFELSKKGVKAAL